MQDEWGPDQEAALAEIKKRLITPPILAYPDPTKPFFLSTDASKNFVGCVLKQKNVQGQEQVIDFGSSTLNSCQRRYPMHEKELYACVFAFHRYRIYLEGRTDTQLYTDNMALTFLKANKYEDISGRLIR